MRKTMLALTALFALTAGCGQASEAADKAFDENFRSNCIASATGGPLTADKVAEACDCALARINERYDTNEKLRLTDEEAQPIAMECLAEVTEANA